MNEISMKGKEASAKEEAAYSTFQIANETVSYTHLDVYKRQGHAGDGASTGCTGRIR